MVDGSIMEGALTAIEYAKLGKEEKKVLKERFLKEGIEIFESIYEDWKAFCAVGKKELRKESKEEGGLKTLYYRKRFEAGSPLTRVVYHAATMYAKLVSSISGHRCRRSTLMFLKTARSIERDGSATRITGSTIVSTWETRSLVRPTRVAAHDLSFGGGGS